MREGNSGWKDGAFLKEKPVSHSSLVEHGESRIEDRASLNKKPVPPVDVLLSRIAETQEDESRREHRISLKEKH
eukprot:5571223-Ditylum_brightwellii.AAC.1